MAKLFILVWFYILNPNPSDPSQAHTYYEYSHVLSEQACKDAGEGREKLSEKLKDEGQIADFGGMCIPVTTGAEGSI